MANNTVYKYPIPFQDEVTLDLPRGAQILSVDFQFDQLCLWALVDSDEQATSQRRLRIAGTGHKLDMTHYYHHPLGTLLTDGGRFVWHVFETTYILET